MDNLEKASMPSDLMNLAKDQFGDHFIKLESWILQTLEGKDVELDELRAKVESQSEIIAELTFNQRLQDAATAAVQERAEKAEAKLAEVQWQPIETAPIEPFNLEKWFMPHSQRMLLWDESACIGTYKYTKKGKGRWQSEFGIINPSHWMPLPTAPIDAEIAK